MKPNPEHSCACCGNTKLAEKILTSDTTPAVLCEGVVQMADKKGNYRLGQLKERADRLNGIRSPEQRVADLVEKMRKQLGRTASSRER